MLVVTVERNRHLQSHPNQAHAELVLPSAVPKEGSIQRLWKEYPERNEDNEVIGKRREKAGIVTILHTESPVFFFDISLDVAQTCGFKTTQALQEFWVSKHPRAERAGIVWYVLGDWRDRDRYLNWTGKAGGDYITTRHRSMDPEAPVPAEIVEGYALQARQRDEARRAQAALALASETPSQRLLRLQRYIEHLRVTVGEDAARATQSAIRQHMRVVEQRIKRAEGRK